MDTSLKACTEGTSTIANVESREISTEQGILADNLHQVPRANLQGTSPKTAVVKRRRQTCHLDCYKVKHWVLDKETGKIVPDPKFELPSKTVTPSARIDIANNVADALIDKIDWPVTPNSSTVSPKSLGYEVLNKAKKSNESDASPESAHMTDLKHKSIVKDNSQQASSARRQLFPAHDESDVQYPSEWNFLINCPPSVRPKLQELKIDAAEWDYHNIWQIKGAPFFTVMCAQNYARNLLLPLRDEWLFGEGYYSEQLRAAVIELDDIFLFQRCPRRLLIDYITFELGPGARFLCVDTIGLWKKAGTKIKSPPGRPGVPLFVKGLVNFAFKLKPDENSGSLQIECGPQNIHVFQAHALRMQKFTSSELASRRHNLRIPIKVIDKPDQFQFDFLEQELQPDKVVVPDKFVPDMTPIWSSEKEDERVLAHNFSKRTCYRILEKNDITFQSVTTVNKPMPSESNIQAWQKRARLVMSDTDKYQSDRVILFMDETAVRHEANDRIPVPKGLKSVAGGAVNEKSGFSGVTLCARDALSLPPLIILRCKVQNEYDLTTSRILHVLHKSHFSAPSWQFGTYKCVVDSKEYIRPYLMNMEDGCLITVQNEGYMDSAVMQLWIEKLLVRIIPGMKKLLFLDNFSAHLQKDVERCFLMNNIDTIFLPANTTPILCVPDTHYHAPLKSFLSTERGLEIMEESLQWQQKRSALLESGADWDVLPLFNPTNQSNASLLSSYMEFCLEHANNDKFRAGARRAWFNAGLLASDIDGSYKDYTADEKKIDTKKHSTSWYDRELQKKSYMTRFEKATGGYQVCIQS